MNITVSFVLLFILFSGTTGLCQPGYYDAEHRYPVTELQADFRFLRTKLEKINPDLYRYTDKETFNLFFDSLYNCISGPQTATEFYDIITLLNSKINDGHTMLLPGDASRKYFNEHTGFFPFYIAISNNRLYVNMNCSRDTLLKEGTEIININGISAAEILDHLLKRQIRDGRNQTYPVWILSQYFKDYYSFSFGHPVSFSITYRRLTGEQQTTTVAALPRDSIKYYREAKYAERIPGSYEKQGIVLETGVHPGIALLTIRSFDNDILKSEYKQAFRSTIDNSFARIHDEGIHDLIIDLRDNQGGDWEPGKILLSYLLLQPLVYLENSAQSSTLTPFENNYTGNLYVLINGGSFSNSGIVCSYLESTGRALFIGEEAAGNKNLINGEPRGLVLPHTKIMAEISTRKFVIRNDVNDGHGVKPTYQITPAVEQIIRGQDSAKEFTFNLILNNKK